MRKYASAKDHAAKTENDPPPFWFYGESIRTSVHGSHIVIVEASSQKCHRGNFVFTARHSSGSSPKVGCLC